MSFRTTVCTLTGIIAVALLLFFKPAPEFRPHGLFLPAGKTYPAISADAVKIYNTAPNHSFETLGLISVEQKYTTMDQDENAQLFQKIKLLAASVGANGVVIDSFQHVNSEVGAVIMFFGTAIKS